MALWHIWCPGVGKVSLTTNTSFCRQYIIFIILNQDRKSRCCASRFSLCSPLCIKSALAAEEEITGYSCLNLHQRRRLLNCLHVSLKPKKLKSIGLMLMRREHSNLASLNAGGELGLNKLLMEVMEFVFPKFLQEVPCKARLTLGD